MGKRIYTGMQKECNQETKNSARFVLDKNIVCGNALTLMQVDEGQQDTKYPIVFSEWSFPFNDAKMHRKDYTMAELLSASQWTDETKRDGSINHFFK